MFMDDRPLSKLRPTQGWNMHQPRSTKTPLKKPPTESPLSTSLYTQPAPARPPLLSKTSSSSSLGGLEQNITPFQAFLLRTPPLQHDPDKPLPPTPVQTPAAADDWDTSSGQRSSSIYSRTPSHCAPESTGSWQTDDLEETSRIVLPAIAYSVSVPDFKSQDATTTLLEPRRFSPLLTSPTMSTLSINSSPATSRPATTHLPSTEVPRKKRAMVSLNEAQEILHAPGARIMLPEELRAQAEIRSKTKSHGPLRLTSSDVFSFHVAPSPPPSPPKITTLVDRQGRVRSITTPPASATQLVDYPFSSPDNRLPSINAFPVGIGLARDMVPPTPTIEENFQSEDERGRRRERGKLSLDVSKYNFPASPETYVHDPYRFQLGNEPTNSAEEYHTLLAQTYRPPSPATSSYDSDDSVRRHMKMIPQPLFSSNKRPARKSGALRKGSAVSRYRASSRSSMSSSGRRSNSFDLRLSLSPTGSRHASRGSDRGFGDIPISPPSTQPPQSPIARNLSTRTAGSRRYHRDSRLEPKYYTQPLQQGPRMNKKTNSKPSKFSSRPNITSSQRSQTSKTSIDSSMTRPTLGTGFSPTSPHPPGAPLLTKSVIEMKLLTPFTSPQTSPLGTTSPTPVVYHPSPTSSAHQNIPLDESPIFGSRKPFFQRVAMRSLRRANNRKEQDPTPNSPHPFPSPQKPHLGWSNDQKIEFDQAAITTPPSPPTAALTPSGPVDGKLHSTTEEVESPTGRKASVFGNVRERFVENKAQRRREDLKRMIRVVPNVGPTEVERRVSEARKSSVGSSRSIGLSKGLGGYGWV